jgi:acylphosphatase
MEFILLHLRHLSNRRLSHPLHFFASLAPSCLIRLFDGPKNRIRRWGGSPLCPRRRRWVTSPFVSERRTYWFSGRVQGVGFRYTTQAIAKRHAVVGYVRNLRDGRVELVMEGEPAEMDQVVNRLKEQMEGHISRVTQDVAPATGEFKEFGIRHG